MTSSTQPARPFLWSALVCLLAGVVVFQFFGNATRGYIPSSSLFYWWGFQWMNPGSETEHGWLILGLSVWLWWRNLRIADRGLGIADFPKPKSGNWKPESEGQRSEMRDQNGEWMAELPSQSRSSSLPAAAPSPVSGLRFPVSKPSQSAIRDSQSIAPAIAAMLGGLALHAVGFAAQQTRVSIVAFLIFTWGVMRLAGGRRWSRAAKFPLAFMLFAIPIGVLDEIGLPLRLWVTTAGERIAHFAGIDLVRSGTQLVAPDGRFNYDVAAPCSGVRSLMALMALSVLLGYLNFQTWSRRALVFALCFPLVYLGNVARIVAIVFAAQAGGAEWGDTAHNVMGYGVFVIVLGGLLLMVAALHRWWPENSPLLRHPLDDEPDCHLMDDDVDRGAKGAGMPHAVVTAAWSEPAVERPIAGAVSSQNRRRRAGASSMAVMLGATVVVGFAVAEMIFLNRLIRMPPRGEVGVVLAADGLNPVELPAFLGTEWIGQRADVSAIEREILPPDTGFSRKNYAFIGDRTRDVFLSIVLSGRDRTSIHRPELCLVGQGWTIEGAVPHTFRFPVEKEAAGRDFRATVLRVRREVPAPRGKVVVPQLVAYWFIAGDAVVASHWQRFAHDAWNRVARARADRWAYVLIQTDARDGEVAAIARMQAVLDGTLTTFQRPQSAQ